MAIGESMNQLFEAMREESRRVAREEVKAIFENAIGGRPARPTNGAEALTPRRALDPRCRVLDCPNKGLGPRNAWLCEKHKDLPKKEKARVLQEYKKRASASAL